MALKTTRKPQYLVCRYCLKDSNKFSDIYFISDENEVYEKMVKDTFNIQVFYPKSINKIVCIKCVEDFRLAAKVKQNILESQKKLTEQSDNMSTKLGSVSPKQELDSNGFDEYETENGDTDAECKQDFSKAVNSVVLKTEDNQQGKEKKGDLVEKSRVNRSIKSKNKVIKLESLGVKEMLYKIRSDSRKACRDVSRNKNTYLVTKRTKAPSKKGSSTTTEKDPKADRSEAKLIFNVRNNTLKLITNSNMCLFTSKRTKYACYSCPETYLDFRELREHSNCHMLNYSQIRRCRGMSYNNVDISNLTCNLCSHPCPDLKDLREHLTNKHDIAFGKGEHLLLPFRLEDGFKCVVCGESFQTFTRLSIHMNRHSTSNVCENCGAAYMNRRSLRNHINSVHKEKQCTKCSAVFPTHSTRANHMRIAHGIGGYKRYCMKCEMTFRYSYELVQHMIDKHGAKQQIRNCEHCDKRFHNLIGLKTHVRSVHIGERNYPCSICHMRFFTTSDKKRHERTHGDEKSFSCSVCEVKFRSKDSMRRHLRKQHENAKTPA